MYNKVILVGNLTRDVEIRYLPSGQALGKTAIATNRKYKVNNETKEEICFIDITFWGRSAEVANQYLKRGSKILVEGRLTFEQWSDNMGNKRSKHSITVETMQMIDTRGGNSQDNAPRGNYQNNQNQPTENNYQQQENRNNYSQNNSYNNHNNTNSHQQQPQAKENIPEIDIDDDEIPF